MNIQGIDHVAVTITDEARAKAFYGGFLMLEELPRPASFDFPGAWYRAGNMIIHLVGRAQADALSGRHFCFNVPSFSAALKKCEAVGLPIERKYDQKIEGIERFFVRDPDGNRIEFQAPENS